MTANLMDTATTLVIGGTGKTGRRVAERLTANFSEGFLTGPVRDGVLALPAGDAAEPFADFAHTAAATGAWRP